MKYLSAVAGRLLARGPLVTAAPGVRFVERPDGSYLAELDDPVLSEMVRDREDLQGRVRVLEARLKQIALEASRP